MKKILIAVILLSGLSFTTLAQTNNLDGDYGLKGSFNYLSNQVFKGRTDSIDTRTLAPALLYRFNSGFYVSGTLNFVLNPKNRLFDGSDLEAGYDFDINDQLSAGFSAAKYFYSSNSTRITSAISSILSAYLYYDINNIISPEINADYSISARNIKNDFFLSAGASHQFNIKRVFGNDDELDLLPEFLAELGSQNFYNGYFTRRRKVVATTEQLTAAEETSLSKFNLLDYHVDLPVTYKIKNLQFHITPSLAFPQNKLPTDISTKLANKKSLFYVEAGVSINFAGN